MITSVIFDIDDTLYDQMQPFATAWQQVFTDIKIVNMDQLYKIFRQQSDKIFPQYQQHLISLESMWLYRMKATFQAMKIENQTNNQILKFQHIYNYNLQHISLYPKMKILLTRLKAFNYHLAIISNGGTMHQKSKAHALGLEEYICQNNIFISEEIGIAKPDPQIFVKVLEQQQLLPNQIVYVGDNFINDVMGAQQAGLFTVWFNHRHNLPENKEIRPNLEITQENSLLQIIDFVKKH